MTIVYRVGQAGLNRMKKSESKRKLSNCVEESTRYVQSLFGTAVVVFVGESAVINECPTGSEDTVPISNFSIVFCAK